MSSPPFMPWYVRDYVADTQHLTRDQHGGYRLLIDACWLADGKLPDDDALLARITLCRGKREWAELKSKLAPFFKISRGFWRHKRVIAELKKAQRLHASRQLGGSLAQAQLRASRACVQTEPESDIKKKKEVEEKKDRVRADIEAKSPRFATIERSSKPTQPSNAKAHLMQQCARWLPEDAVAGFWAAMMGDNAQAVLDQTATAMHASGWKDRG
jgi:uncharacterized protein YdaU (DUF1376 family)